MNLPVLQQLAGLARYLDRLLTTDTYTEVTNRIANYHRQQKHRP